MAKSCLDTILILASFLALVGIVVLFGMSPIGWILGFIAFFGIMFIDVWIYLGRKKVRQHKQKAVICPRCMIPVDITSGVCPQCNQKV